MQLANAVNATKKLHTGIPSELRHQVSSNLTGRSLDSAEHRGCWCLLGNFVSVSVEQLPDTGTLVDCVIPNLRRTKSQRQNLNDRCDCWADRAFPHVVDIVCGFFRAIFQCLEWVNDVPWVRLNSVRYV